MIDKKTVRQTISLHQLTLNKHTRTINAMVIWIENLQSTVIALKNEIKELKDKA